MDLWMEGYVATGERAPASHLGVFSGENLEEAVEAWAKTLSAQDQGLVSFNPPRFWGCRIFDNEAEAREVFG